MIIRDDYRDSNLLSLFFEITTFYLGYAATLWFILYVKILQVRTGVDRTVLYSEEYKIEGNI